jgi:hypothetical protein
MVGRVATMTYEGGPACRGRTVNVGLKTDASVTVTVGNSSVTVCRGSRATIEPMGRNPKGEIQLIADWYFQPCPSCNIACYHELD